MSDPAVRDLSLYDLQLAPSSILRIRFLDDALNRTSCIRPCRALLTGVPDVNVPAPLADDVLLQAVDLPKPPDFDRVDPSPSGSGVSRNAASSGQGSGAGSERKLPKWLKLSSEHPSEER